MKRHLDYCPYRRQLYLIWIVFSLCSLVLRQRKCNINLLRCFVISMSVVHCLANYNSSSEKQ